MILVLMETFSAFYSHFIRMLLYLKKSEKHGFQVSPEGFKNNKLYSLLVGVGTAETDRQAINISV